MGCTCGPPPKNPHLVSFMCEHGTRWERSKSGRMIKRGTVSEDKVQKTWAKILGDVRPLGRGGAIPVYTGHEWKVFRNSQTIFPGAENCADPVKVDVLRQNVNDLLGHYPKTVPQLEKLGIRVKALLNRHIVHYEDVVAWAESIFNTGPFSRGAHVGDTVELAYDDIVIEVKPGVCVIPAGPKGQGNNETLDFTVPGSKKRYGARHEYTTAAFRAQVPKKKPAKPPRYRGQTAEGEPLRPRGRPRLDGLVPGSTEAKRADRKKQKEKEARRARGATITKLPARRRLTRIGDQRKTS